MIYISKYILKGNSTGSVDGAVIPRQIQRIIRGHLAVIPETVIRDVLVAIRRAHLHDQVVLHEIGQPAGALQVTLVALPG